MFWLIIVGYFVIRIIYLVSVKLEENRTEVRGHSKLSKAEKAEAQRIYDMWTERYDKAVAKYEVKKSDLWLLGLTSCPQSLDELKQARRRAMLQAHPDRGGSEAIAVDINNAYSTIAQRFAA